MTELFISPQTAAEPFGALQLGREHVPPFNPLEYVLSKVVDDREQIYNRNIIRPPDDVLREQAIGAYILRLYPRPAYSDDEPGERHRIARTPEMLEAQVRAAEPHLQLLSSLEHIAIPPDRIHGAGHNPYHPEDTVLYTYTNSIVGDELSLYKPQHEPWRAKMVTDLIDYMIRVKEQGWTHFLSDASKIMQYTVGRFTTDPQESERLIMHDIDPELDPIQEDGRTSDAYRMFMITLGVAYNSVQDASLLSAETRAKYQQLGPMI
jgi:hypothetical protein